MCRPSGSTDLSPASPSSVVSRRPWSVSTSRVSPVGLPSSSSTGASIGAISRLNRPSSTATRAFCWEARPKASRSSRVMPRLRAIRSAASNWLGMSIVQSSGRGSPSPGGTLPPSGMRDIASTPQAIPTSMVPAAIMSCTRCAACWPEPHWASIVVPPVCWGSPACSQARRTMSLDCSPAWVTQPPTTCSTSSGSSPAALEHLGLHEPEEHGGVHAGEPALALAEGSADGVDDHGGAHGGKLEHVLVRHKRPGSPPWKWPHETLS